ncbi:MAG TPA: DUF4334 domain-containing protein [Kofleriaceae bacterium]|nr:DUF4334 domain-containing protein [Kofleriaceae bacterium]
MDSARGRDALQGGMAQASSDSPTGPSSGPSAGSAVGSAAGSSAAATTRLAALEHGTDSATALAFFDALPAVTIDEMLGAWRGSGLPTGHRLDGLLEKFGWHGKRFDSADLGHPLVFDRPGGGTVDLHPFFVPFGFVVRYPRLLGGDGAARAFRRLAPLLRTRTPRARLRMVEQRGVVSAAMIYDDLPICDAFRRVDADTRLGLMDARGMRKPFFFVLRREPAPAV